jgi:excisionase family DNA binding protein
MTSSRPSHHDAPELLWTVKQVAKALSLGERTVWKHSATGQIPRPIRIGRSVRWERRAIEAWLDKKLREGKGIPAQR